MIGEGCRSVNLLVCYILIIMRHYLIVNLRQNHLLTLNGINRSKKSVDKWGCRRTFGEHNQHT